MFDKLRDKAARLRFYPIAQGLRACHVAAWLHEPTDLGKEVVDRPSADDRLRQLFIHQQDPHGYAAELARVLLQAAVLDRDTPCGRTPSSIPAVSVAVQANPAGDSKLVVHRAHDVVPDDDAAPAGFVPSCLWPPAVDPAAVHVSRHELVGPQGRLAVPDHPLPESELGEPVPSTEDDLVLLPIPDAKSADVPSSHVPGERHDRDVALRIRPVGGGVCEEVRVVLSDLVEGDVQLTAIAGALSERVLVRLHERPRIEVFGRIILRTARAVGGDHHPDQAKSDEPLAPPGAPCIPTRHLDPSWTLMVARRSGEAKGRDAYSPAPSSLIRRETPWSRHVRDPTGPLHEL